MSNLVPTGAIDFSPLTTGLTSQFEGGVESALPIVAVVMAAFLVIRTVRSVIGA
jgi:hypothetical protein